MRFGYNELKGTPPLQINNTMGGVAEDYIIYGSNPSLINPILKNNSVTLGTIQTTLHALPQYNIYDFAQKSTSKATHYLASVTYNGTEEWTYNSGWSDTTQGLYGFKAPKPSDMKTDSKGLSNYLKVSALGDERPISNEIVVGGTNIALNIQNITTVEALKSYLATRPLTIVYELATPTTETITMPELTLNDGTNIIEASSNTSASQIDINLWNNFHDLTTLTTEGSNNVYTADNKLLILKEVN